MEAKDKDRKENDRGARAERPSGRAADAGLELPTERLEPRKDAWIAELLIAVLTAALLIGTTWAVRRPIGDMYVSLAAGRDVTDGKLAQPDDWSFLSEKTGKVWINQNWGTHLLYYATHQLAGQTGLLVLKALLLAVLATGVVMASRWRGVSWPIAVLVAGGILIAGRSYVDQRPNLSTLVLAPIMLWLLYRTRSRPHRIWVATAVLWLWANVHGGFIFGIGMMGLWTLCRVVPAMVGEGLKAGLRQQWPLLAGTAAGILLAGLANPFGMTNLTHPFVIATSEEWRVVSEWLPLFAESPFGTRFEFLIATGILGGLVLVRLLVAAAQWGQQGGPERPTPGQVGRWVFDVALAAVVIAMALKSRRFVPLALVVLSPLLALHVGWFLRLGGRVWPVTLAAAGLLLPTLFYARTLWRVYQPENPIFPPQTVFQRMIGQDVQPVGPARFLNANGASGRAVNEWRWEGYLHWRCPQVKLFMGGRAQQVYLEKHEMLRNSLFGSLRRGGAETAADFSQRRAEKREWIHAILANRLRAGLIVLPHQDASYELFLEAVWEDPASTWACVYLDPDNIVLANTALAENRALAEKARSGRLRYPTELAGRLSRAAYLESPVAEADPNEAFEAYQQANRTSPTPVAYKRMVVLAQDDDVLMRRLINHFVEEDRRLGQRVLDGAYMRPDGHQLLRANHYVARVLAEVYRNMGRDQQATRQAQMADKLLERLELLYERWQ